MLPKFLLIAWFALPVLFCGAMLCVRRRFHPGLVCILCLATMIAGVFIVANHVWAVDAQLLAEIDKYDPDSPEAERASQEWANDVNRSFLLLLSPVLTAVWYGGVFAFFFGLRWVVRQLFPAKYASVHAKTDGEAAEQRGDDGNPYQSSNVG